MIVGIHGAFTSGKTFLLNNLANTKLPEGRCGTTKGLSIKISPKYVLHYTTTSLYIFLNREDLPCIFLDTAGHGVPVKSEVGSGEGKMY